MKVAFIGHPGSGKTYASTKLAERLGVGETDIDVLLHNLWYFFFKKPYRKALRKLMAEKDAWIIDGYGGRRMPATLWRETDHIIYINLPKPELRRNVCDRYRYKKSNREATHGQHLFVNVLKNLAQIYVLDYSLKRCIHEIKGSDNASKLIEVHSRQELDDALANLGNYV